MRINKYLLFALIFFFFNSLGLPMGLTYTALLSPFFYLWLLTTCKKEVMLPFLVLLTPFVILQVLSVVDTKSYISSLLYYITVYIFVQTAYAFLLRAPDMEGIFRKILIINFIFCLIAIPFYFSPYSDIFWIEQFLTAGVRNFKRFRLFTYEASYYSTLFAPIFFFYFFRIILRQNRSSSWLLLVMMSLPLALSFSLGVLVAISLAIALTFAVYPMQLISKRRTMHLLSIVGCGALLVLFVMLIFFPENVLFLRVDNIVSGNDLSGKSRTTNSFYLADKILELRSHLWGIGPGQTKVIGIPVIRDFYRYPNALPDSMVQIPNVVAETWAVFGWLGLILRFGLEGFLFFRTRVWTNYYRLALFLFIFIYQFTGSFITNLGEYVIWLMAFVNVFPQFDAAKGRLRAALER
jgi:hypothetical protein